MSWMAEMSSYRHLAELKRRYAAADAAARAAARTAPEPDAAERADAAITHSSNSREAARPLETRPLETAIPSA